MSQNPDEICLLLPSQFEFKKVFLSTLTSDTETNHLKQVVVAVNANYFWSCSSSCIRAV